MMNFNLHTAHEIVIHLVGELFMKIRSRLPPSTQKKIETNVNILHRKKKTTTDTAHTKTPIES